MSISRNEYEEARSRTLDYFRRASIVLTEEEKRNIEVADFGLERLDEIGVELITYINTKRVGAKDVVLFPWQICPQHSHPPFDEQPGKEETFRCRWGTVYLYVEGFPTEKPKANVPEDRKEHFTVWHEIILEPGDQYTVEAGKIHWFQGGVEGAILSEFSTPSTDEVDIFTDPEIERIPEIN